MTKTTAQVLDGVDLTGRTVVITGASSGLGLQTARAMQSAGAEIIAAVRDLDKTRAAIDCETVLLDLTDLRSARTAAATIADRHDRIDVLINNAGVMAIPKSRTVDGFETQFGTNHLGHFALTNLLLPHVTDRVVTVASGAHRGGKIRFDDPNWTTGRYDSWAAYSQSKLANLLFVLELQRRLTAAGSPVRSLSAHPGYSATNLQSHSGRVMNAAMKVGNAVLAQSDEQGALNTLYAASQDLPGASYVGPDGRFEMRGHPTLVGRTTAASDVQAAQRLWTLSEELTGVHFALAARSV